MHEYLNLGQNPENNVGLYILNNQLEFTLHEFTYKNFQTSLIVSKEEIDREITTINTSKNNCNFRYEFNGQNLSLKLNSNKKLSITQSNRKCADQIIKNLLIIKKEKYEFLKLQLQELNNLLTKIDGDNTESLSKVIILRKMLLKHEMPDGNNLIKSTEVMEKNLSFIQVLKSVFTGAVFLVLFLTISSYLIKK